MSNALDILSVQNLSVSYGNVQVLHDVSLAVGKGEIVGIVGESGSGKSTLLRAVVRLLPPSARISAGSIAFDGQDVMSVSAQEMRTIRGSGISYLFQNAQQSFDPLFTIGKQFNEVMRAHGFDAGQKRRASGLVVGRKGRVQIVRSQDAQLNNGSGCDGVGSRRVGKHGSPGMRGQQIAALKRMGFADPDRILGALPSELSGGMGQRVALSFALAGSPSLLLADEPTSALDGDAQRRVLGLLRELNEQDGLSILLVSHNIDLVASLAQRIIVMREGCIVEEGESGRIIDCPQHPYTRQLIAAIPQPRNDMKVEMLGGGHAARGR